MVQGAQEGMGELGWAFFFIDGAAESITLAQRL